MHDDDLLAAMHPRSTEVSSFDTADVYGRGRGEELLGQFVAEVGRENLIVATKVGLWRGRQPDLYLEERMHHRGL